MNSSIKATLLFIFDSNLEQVLLIEKQKPEHHKGLLNGLGGKLEKLESHRDCASRELLEEANISVAKKDWIRIGRLNWDVWRVSIWTVQLESIDMKHSFSDPNVQWYPVNQLPQNVISNLRWLIPLSIDVIHLTKRNEKPPKIVVSY